MKAINNIFTYFTVWMYGVATMRFSLDPSLGAFGAMGAYGILTGICLYITHRSPEGVQNDKGTISRLLQRKKSGV